jgi:hypothetical protein
VKSLRARATITSLLPLLAVSALGCKGSSNPNDYPPPNTGGGGSGGPTNGTVMVVIESPQAGLPPFGPGSLVGVSAHVFVDGGTDFIDGTTVQVRLSKEGSSQTIDMGLLVIESGDLYSGRISLGGDLASGRYTLTVSARSSGGGAGSAMVDIDLDRGPTLIVTSPVEGKSYKKMATVEVIASDPFGLAVDGAGAVIPPSARIGPVDVMLFDAGIPDTFRGTIDFDDQEPPLFGAQLLTVAVENVYGHRAEVQIIFFVDNEGPTITSTQPAPGEIVGSIVLISATIGDNAGVLDSSVIAVIGDETGTPLFELPLKPSGAGFYSTLFDSGRLTECKEPPDASPCIVFPTISFRASDLVNNESVVAYEFAVDDIAPLADLDPPSLRDMKLDRVFRCSWSFDPLGNDNNIGDMPNDATYVPQVFDLRARVQDKGNDRASGLKLVPISLVDPAKTDVYVLDDTIQPLVVDTDGDGACDSINPLLIPTTEPPTNSNQVLKIRLAPVPKKGSADFTGDASIPASAPCEPGIDPERPKPICSFAQPTIAISYAFQQPAIWSIEPIDERFCHGGQFDTKANNIDNGWACIAVAATDQAGNFGVSRPLRVNIDKDPGFETRHQGGVNSFGVSAQSSPQGPPPNCTGTWDRATNTVSPTPCTTFKYPANQYCYLGDC